MPVAVKAGNLIASTVILLWGGAALVYAVASGGSGLGGNAYQTGQIVGLMFGLLMLAAGGRGIRNELRKRRS
jgi:hypothetical protein